MPKLNVKKSLFSQFAKIGKALASENRLELIEFLAQGPRSVESLANVMGISVANTSQHLQRMRQAGLVVSEMKHHHACYQLADDSIVELLIIIQKVAQRNLAEVDQLVNTYLVAKDDLEPISANELLQRIKDDSVLVIDVRPTEEFNAGHLPTAVNISLKDLEKKLKQLPSNKEIVAYCRGPYCVLAFQAVAKLRENKRQARRFNGGFPEWKLAGLPIATNERDQRCL